jgi:hypothetical protein
MAKAKSKKSKKQEEKLSEVPAAPQAPAAESKVLKTKTASARPLLPHSLTREILELKKRVAVLEVALAALSSNS